MRLYNLGPCYVCGKDLFAGLGQVVRFHAECRKKGRQRFGKATKTVGIKL